MVQAQRAIRRRRANRREKMFLFLVLLLMLLSAVFGLYLASRGLHPRQLRRRLPSRSHQQLNDLVVLAQWTQVQKDPLVT